ncbi:hypothetical protein B0J17DRAFT_647425 [Rhizoctonia solani]|nr:hypothetical protein B0J17DRAFT_647425 [Rhizoctonia solani]
MSSNNNPHSRKKSQLEPHPYEFRNEDLLQNFEEFLQKVKAHPHWQFDKPNSGVNNTVVDGGSDGASEDSMNGSNSGTDGSTNNFPDNKLNSNGIEGMWNVTLFVNGHEIKDIVGQGVTKQKAKNHLVKQLKEQPHDLLVSVDLI